MRDRTRVYLAAVKNRDKQATKFFTRTICCPMNAETHLIADDGVWESMRSSFICTSLYYVFFNLRLHFSARVVYMQHSLCTTRRSTTLYSSRGGINEWYTLLLVQQMYTRENEDDYSIEKVDITQFAWWQFLCPFLILIAETFTILCWNFSQLVKKIFVFYFVY